MLSTNKRSQSLENKHLTTDSKMVRVYDIDHSRLMKMKHSQGYTNVASVVHMLLSRQETPVCTLDKIMDKKVPIVLTGKPLSGKTFFCRKKLLPKLKRMNPPFSCLVIDTWDEYKKVPNVGYDLYSLDFKEVNDQLRFVPNKQSRVAESEVEQLFAHLDMKRDELSRWVIIVEEAHAYKDIPSFSKFLYGSRRIVRKMIVVTPKSDAFRGLIRLVIY